MLKQEYRLTYSGDAWGNAMNWLFHIADELYHNRLTPVPDDWGFRPSPHGPTNHPGDYETECVAEASDEDLIRFGNVLNRYAGLLKRAGHDY
jgi:hypothetical protein